MAKGKRSGSEKVRRNIYTPWRIAFGAVIVVLLVAIIFILKNIISLKSEQSELAKQEQALQNKKEELSAELQGVDDLEYIEEQARKLLKMIKPGEVLYILNGEDPRPESEKTEGEEPVIPAPAPVVTEEPEEVYEEPEYEEPQEEYPEETEEAVQETEEPMEETSEGTGEENYSEESSPEGEG